MSTGITTATSCDAARRPAAIAATGPVPGSVSPPRPDGEPLVARLPEQAPGSIGERLSLVLGELLRRAEPTARPADEQDPRQRLIRHGSV